jgi:hypothetical protein
MASGFGTPSFSGALSSSGLALVKELGGWGSPSVHATYGADGISFEHRLMHEPGEPYSLAFPFESGTIALESSVSAAAAAAGQAASDASAAAQAAAAAAATADQALSAASGASRVVGILDFAADSPETMAAIDTFAEVHDGDFCGVGSASAGIVTNLALYLRVSGAWVNIPLPVYQTNDIIKIASYYGAYRGSSYAGNATGEAIVRGVSPAVFYLSIAGATPIDNDTLAILDGKIAVRDGGIALPKLAPAVSERLARVAVYEGMLDATNGQAAIVLYPSTETYLSIPVGWPVDDEIVVILPIAEAGEDDPDAWAAPGLATRTRSTRLIMMRDAFPPTPFTLRFAAGEVMGDGSQIKINGSASSRAVYRCFPPSYYGSQTITISGNSFGTLAAHLQPHDLIWDPGPATIHFFQRAGDPFIASVFLPFSQPR